MACRLVQFLTLLASALSASAALPGVHQGWNTSIGNAADRIAAARHFDFTVAGDEENWQTNVLTPFVGKTLHMTKIDIIDRNWFNTVIEAAVGVGSVLWTVLAGPQGIVGDLVEHINGVYTGRSFTAGYGSSKTWLENDRKSLFGIYVSDDWGVVDVTLSTATSLVMHYRSYQQGRVCHDLGSAREPRGSLSAHVRLTQQGTREKASSERPESRLTYW
eukprot:CAMPEP_0204527952 /NCGR_PEP_ID=MMETSP0661-20131031/9257_1 /ASSEMBLY_ACC=CAM_ASM_000606 /TAXON_ID=109239 /ORGANISM="Alexandrium margalefi, Strain AMGDE01CS-322" /LENGTH=217 /DNA_ID=CAMNT_0051533893 /DNA_START=58 /DNA_END=711 /DNA_ORIENTATION=-